jgi:hypothetical protein
MSHVSATIRGALALLAFGCMGQEIVPAVSPPPVLPVLAPGMAMLRGRVVQIDGQPVAGATVTVLDRPASEVARTATSGVDGSWELVVPGSTTVTLRAEASGFAGALSGSFQVLKGQTSTELELMVLPPAFIDMLTATAGPRPAEYGVVALDVRSLGGACDPVGGTITIEPSQLGRVLYSRANGFTANPNLTAIQPGAHPAGWLIGVLPPGAYYRLTFAKTGCTPKAAPVEYRGRRYDGTWHIASKILSNGLLFVE